MKPAPLPDDEDERMTALARYAILDTEPERAYDDIVQLAANIAGTPMAFINFLDDRRQWFKSRIGFEARETPREYAFCGYTILQPDRVMVVEDALDDDRFVDNPLVTGEPNIRTYVGVPLVTPEGHPVGTLSVLDHEPRKIGEREIRALRMLAREAVAVLELRRAGRDLREALADCHVLGEGLLRTMREMQNVMDTIPDVVFVLDDGASLRRWNEHAERVSGYTHDDLRGRDALTLVAEEDQPAIRKAIEDVYEFGHGETEANLRMKDGRLVPYWFSSRPLRDDEGEVVGLVGVGRDVTRQREAEVALRRRGVELERASRELRASNQDLEAFASAVSHDLRAPARAVRQLSEDLVEDFGDRLGDEGASLARRVSGEARRMEQLVSDLLGLSRAAQQPLRHEEVDLSAVANDAIAALRARKPRKGREQVQDGIVVQGDPRLLRVVLDNLLENAWKYTARTSEPRIEVGATAEGDWVTCFVRDNGAGFDPMLADRLFKPFTRLHGPEYPGTGIGLSTVRRIVSRHGGEVRAEGAPGRGATFFFTLPAPGSRLAT